MLGVRNSFQSLDQFDLHRLLRRCHVYKFIKGSWPHLYHAECVILDFPLNIEILFQNETTLWFTKKQHQLFGICLRYERLCSNHFSACYSKLIVDSWWPHFRDILKVAIKGDNEISMHIQALGVHPSQSRFHRVVLDQIFCSSSASIRMRRWR